MDGYFEKTPGPSQTQANIIPEERRISLSLSPALAWWPALNSLLPGTHATDRAALADMCRPKATVQAQKD